MTGVVRLKVSLGDVNDERHESYGKGTNTVLSKGS